MDDLENRRYRRRFILGFKWAAGLAAVMAAYCLWRHLDPALTCVWALQILVFRLCVAFLQRANGDDNKPRKKRL